MYVHIIFPGISVKRGIDFKLKSLINNQLQYTFLSISRSWFAASLYHNCDSIRRCHDAFDYDGSDRNYDLRSIRLRYDYDTTTTKN